MINQEIKILVSNIREDKPNALANLKATYSENYYQKFLVLIAKR